MALVAVKRARTSVVVAAVAAIAAAAAVDTVRSRGTSTPATPRPSPVAAELDAAGLSGVLRFTDRGCRVRALRLPSLEPAVPPEVRRCRSDGTPLGTCRGSVVQMRFRLASRLALSDCRAPRTTRVVSVLTRLPEIEEAAVSPDRRWAALASRSSVYFLRIDADNPRIIRLPLAATDLAWVSS